MDSLKSIRHIISIKDFSRQQIVDILRISGEMETRRDDLLKNKILATLFFEPSTRTRLSFESAMLQLGGKTMGFADAMVSSTKKGETLSDTIKVISQYSDIIVIRHPLEGIPTMVVETNGKETARDALLEAAKRMKKTSTGFLRLFEKIA